MPCMDRLTVKKPTGSSFQHQGRKLENFDMQDIE
jgi:hypothetical protein